MKNTQTYCHPYALLNDVTRVHTILESLDLQASLKPDCSALMFLADGEVEESPVTYAELAEQSKAFAAGLLRQVGVGDRVILLFQSSYEFVIAFFGCLRAGVIAVPMPVPSRRINEWIRIETVKNDCGAKLTITPEKIRARLLEHIDSAYRPGELNFVSHETVLDYGAGQKGRFPEVLPSHTAFLQYTSGSTGSPKGVVLTHSNLMENQKLIYHGLQNYGKCVFLSWLPLFHDMGLIGNMLHSIYIGQPFVFMAPSAFLQRPIRWLRAVSKYKARVSGGPNFAYQLCAEKIKDADKKGLDLSHWEIAFNGAEPIRSSTLKQFHQAFQSCGFSETAFYPCYGAAESTLIISGAECDKPPFLLDVDKHAFENNRIVPVEPRHGDALRLASSGIPLFDQSVVVVDPEIRREVQPLTVGEIWVASPCNARGYWGNPEASRAAFHNRLPGRSARYLNTGDLGFTTGTELFITGRSKDLLIFNGRNMYPQDIEACSEATGLELKPGRCAAFSVVHDDKEKLVLVHEVERSNSRKIDAEAIIERIRIGVNREFSVGVHAVALVVPSTIPMTSSGKIRRQECKKQYLAGELKLIAGWSADEGMIHHVKTKVAI
ncbi:MAG: fatty acyl-AMP ligase [Gammaproteobacteria bacterium]